MTASSDTGIIPIDSELAAEHFGIAEELTVAFGRNLSAPSKPFLRDQPHICRHAERAGSRASQSLESGPALAPVIAGVAPQSLLKPESERAPERSKFSTSCANSLHQTESSRESIPTILEVQRALNAVRFQ